MRHWAVGRTLGLDMERLVTDDVRSAPLFMTALAKISTSLLDVKHTRTQYGSLITQGTYQDRLSRK